MRRLFPAALLFAATLHAQNAPDVHAVAAKVDAYYNHLSSLKLDYSEHYAGMGLDRTETGTLLLKKPGRMRWNYAQPSGKVFVLDGKNAYFYTPGDQQAQRVSAKQLDDLRSPLRFLLGHTQIEKELGNITATSLPNGDIMLTGVPKGMEQRVHALAITCSPATGVITALRIQEADGPTTEFRFSGLQINPHVNDADFRFTPPAGVTIINGMPPI